MPLDEFQLLLISKRDSQYVESTLAADLDWIQRLVPKQTNSKQKQTGIQDLKALDTLISKARNDDVFAQCLETIFA